MSFPTQHYADSDADDEYERSILTSPMPPTDDEASSIGDSENGSHEHTPTFAHGGRSSPRTMITEWSTDECAGFLNGLGLGQYGRSFKENEIVGEAIVQLHHEELKEMGVKSMGHRLTILGAIYDTKVKQDVDIESDQYVPPSKEEDIKSRQATQEDLSRIIQSLHLRDRRILEAEAQLKRLQEKYDKLREELMPIARMAKEHNQSLPSPVFPNGTSSLNRSGSNKNKNGLVLNPAPSIHSASPTYPPGSTDRQQSAEHSINASNAVTLAQHQLFGEATSGSTTTFPSPHFPSPGVSPGVQSTLSHHQQQIDSKRGFGSMADPYSRDSNYGATLNTERDTYRPPTSRAPVQTRSVAPSVMNESIREEDRGPPAVEVFKSFRVSMDDPCYKVLPAALKKYSIDADWKQYALYIVYGDQERCLGLEEKPLILFKQLDKEGRKPMFMLRRHVTPEHGFTGPSTAAASGSNLNLQGGASKALPGGVL